MATPISQFRYYVLKPRWMDYPPELLYSNPQHDQPLKGMQSLARLELFRLQTNRTLNEIQPFIIREFVSHFDGSFGKTRAQLDRLELPRDIDPSL